MGLKQRTTTGVYLRLKDGKFYIASNKEENAEGFDELEGTLVDLYFKDETYEGQEQRKLYLTMNDGDENYILGFRIDSRYANDFIKFAKSIDLKEPFTLCAVSRDKTNAKGEAVKENSLLVKQDGTFARAYYSKEHPNGLPQMNQIKVNGKIIWDKTDMLEFFEKVVETELKPQLPKAAPQPKTVIRNEAPESQPDMSEAQEDAPVDKLPWED